MNFIGDDVVEVGQGSSELDPGLTETLVDAVPEGYVHG